jgi:hypothetical protein
MRPGRAGQRPSLSKLLAQRAHCLVGHGDAPVLSEGCEPLISRQGAPSPYRLSGVGRCYGDVFAVLAAPKDVQVRISMLDMKASDVAAPRAAGQPNFGTPRHFSVKLL